MVCLTRQKHFIGYCLKLGIYVFVSRRITQNENTEIGDVSQWWFTENTQCILTHACTNARAAACFVDWNYFVFVMNCYLECLDFTQYTHSMEFIWRDKSKMVLLVLHIKFPRRLCIWFVYIAADDLFTYSPFSETKKVKINWNHSVWALKQCHI